MKRENLLRSIHKIIKNAKKKNKKKFKRKFYTYMYPCKIYKDMSFSNFSLKGAVIKCNQILISICKKKMRVKGGGGLRSIGS